MRIILHSTALLLLLAAASARAAVVTADQVQRAVGAFVRSEVAVDPAADERVEVHTRWAQDVQLPGAGRTSVEVARTSARPLLGPSVLKLSLTVDGRPVREISVTVDVRTFRRVLVARRGVARGETAQADMVQVAQCDVTALRSAVFTEASQVAGKRMRRPLQPGDVLTAEHLEAVPVVARGSSVTIVLQTARLELSAAGEALQDGGQGDRIRVRNVDSGRTLQAIVVDAQTVRLP